MSSKPPEQNLDSSIIPSSYFQGHHCHLPADKLSAYHIHCSKFRKFIFDLTTVRADDIRARMMYRSYAALSAEKYRQYTHFPWSIHPYSKLRLGLEVVFTLAILISNTLLPIHFSESSRHLLQDKHVYVLYGLDVFLTLNIFANFFTGYVEGYTYKHVILDLKRVSCKYLRTWFIIDILSTVSFLPIMLQMKNLTPHLLLVATKLFRLPVLFFYLSNVMDAWKVGSLKRTCIEVFVYIYSYLTWNVYFQFAWEYMVEGTYNPDVPRNCSWMTKGKLWNETSPVRLAYSIDRAVSMLRKNSNLIINKTNNDGSCYDVFYTTAWFIAKILVYHCASKYIIAAYGRESAAAKYFTMTKQVEMYMNQRKLPPRIKDKILKFYEIRYQSRFFEESQILGSVSGQLREDIIMHTGRQLVRELEFLKQMPRPLLLQIGFKLKLAIFIAGDIIYKINTIGDCLYFIDKGTVAIYSASGKEVCHLEDGDFFGEIALVTKNRFRTASVVAVSNCELFRLNREDFDSTIACYPTVYDHIKKVATQRLERTCVLDEYHKAEMRNAK